MNIQMREFHGIGIHDKHILPTVLTALMMKTLTMIIEKIIITSDVGRNICVSSMNKRKTQVGWVVTIRQSA
jgi:hypothetical protein